MMPAAKIMKKHPSLYWINCTRLGCPKAMKDDGFTRPQTNGQMHRKAESDHFCNRKTDLIGNHGTAKFALYFDGEHIGQNCRSQTSGIGVDQEK